MTLPLSASCNCFESHVVLKVEHCPFSGLVVAMTWQTPSHACAAAGAVFNDVPSTDRREV